MRFKFRRGPLKTLSALIGAEPDDFGELLSFVSLIGLTLFALFWGQVLA